MTSKIELSVERDYLCSLSVYGFERESSQSAAVDFEGICQNTRNLRMISGDSGLDVSNKIEESGALTGSIAESILSLFGGVE